MTISPESLARLRELAEKATPNGRWQIVKWEHHTDEVSISEDSLCATYSFVAPSNAQHDEAYLAAANPATVLALLDEVERLRKRLSIPCGGCPGCGSNDCPDAVDDLQGVIERLRAENEKLRADLAAANDLVAKLRAKCEARKIMARKYGRVLHAFDGFQCRECNNNWAETAAGVTHDDD